MISAADDSVPATDTLKARKLSKTWALMFAGNGEYFLPIVRRITDKIGDYNVVYQLDTIQSAVSEAYRAAFDEKFTSLHLSRYGYAGISAFRDTGLAQLGDKFYRLCELIDDFNLDIQLLVSGFGSDRVPHIFEVGSPAEIINHDLLGFGVIGSGFHLANSSLRKKESRMIWSPLSTDCWKQNSPPKLHLASAKVRRYLR